eukprot:TRINITY_DN13586_c0_g1_i1.p1 TRINITY_DN13586_c0_g1~~TRINITY_DN13586_c0_g1_i1.p1  ORF type:complete len:209 (+),score=79.48 TRINITY_DN13586_c0_g1_i1:140-766(+)
MMLDFYGLELKDERTGEVGRNPNEKLVKERLSNLRQCTHNFLRINRILTSLGQLGFERYRQPLLNWLYDEIFVFKSIPNAASSYNNFWRKTVIYDANHQSKTKETENDRTPSVFFKQIEDKPKSTGNAEKEEKKEEKKEKEKEKEEIEEVESEKEEEDITDTFELVRGTTTLQRPSEPEPTLTEKSKTDVRQAVFDDLQIAKKQRSTE